MLPRAAFARRVRDRQPRFIFCVGAYDLGRDGAEELISVRMKTALETAKASGDRLLGRGGYRPVACPDSQTASCYPSF
jgi:hypothetical protein